MHCDSPWRFVRRQDGVGAGLVAALAVVAVAGCDPSMMHRSGRGALQPIADRLRATYPDLASGRFNIVADFESAEHGAIFHLAPAAASGFVGVVTEKAREETGVGSLKVALPDAATELVVEDPERGTWTLPRDWHEYQLLLLSIYSPRALSSAYLSIRSGPEKVIEYRLESIVLHPGWNTLRVDLGNTGERIDIRDVRQLRLGVADLKEPITLYLDDVVLTNNSQDLLGKPDGEGGSLYVRSEGRRLRVGAAKRFELVFAQGRIVEWFDLRNDAGRVRNLTGGGSMGPVPVLIEGDPAVAPQIDETFGWGGAGAAMETSQRLVEANGVRAIVTGEWRFGAATGGTSGSASSETSDAGAAPGSASGTGNADAAKAAPAASDAGGTVIGPVLRWTYAVYPSGHVYLEFNASLPSSGRAGAVGYIVGCAADEGFERVQRPYDPIHDADDAMAYVLYGRGGAERADLLFAFHRATTAPKVKSLRHERDPRLGTLFYGGPPTLEIDWAALLLFWPPDVDGPLQAEPRILDYTHPMPITVDAGRLVTHEPGDIDGDGFNESRGHYSLEPDGNVVRVRLNGQQRPRFSPAFRITGVADRNVWVYADGLIVEPVARDADGNALFVIPRLVDKSMLVEVVTREKTAAGTPPHLPGTATTRPAYRAAQ